MKGLKADEYVRKTHWNSRLKRYDSIRFKAPVRLIKAVNLSIEVKAYDIEEFGREHHHLGKVGEGE